MNRRQFLLDFATLSCCVGIGGMLINSETSQFVPTRITNSKSATVPENSKFDGNEAKKAYEKLEKQGFVAREALYWEKTREGLIKCTLCPRYCNLRPFERGQCKVRISLENKLGTLVYGKPCSVAVDPIEKKPVFHLLPGSTAFSIATAGCLFGCRYCQNWQISQAAPEEVESYDLPPEKLVEEAIANGCKSIAYTYTEPTIFYEYMLDTAKLAKQRGIRNVVVSCGYINPEPLAQLAPFLDVMKVDLKGFTERFYRSVCGGTLAPVLATLKQLSKTNVMMDIVTLVVPTQNDDLPTMQAMFKWILENLGANVSLFLTRFGPTFKMKNLPPTPSSLLTKLREIAMEIGLPYVYLGNVPGHEGENTFCSNCKKILVGRMGYQLTEMNIKNNRCPFCQTLIPGIWE